MMTPQQVYQKNKRSPPGRRRRKRGIRLLVAYALQGAAILLCLLLIILLVCGGLYIREHLAGPPEDLAAASEEPSGIPGKHGEDEEPEKADVLPPSQAPGGKMNYIVVLDAGHGGKDMGCSFNGASEKDIALAVTLLAAEKLRAKVETVLLTREEDADVSLDGRCQFANDIGADIFVSIHCNSYTEDTSVNGFEGYYHDDAKGERLAQYIMDAAGALAVKTRHVRDENYKVLRDTAMPAALMEIGFLSNPAERQRLQTAEYQETIAQAIADGVLEMLKSQS